MNAKTLSLSLSLLNVPHPSAISLEHYLFLGFFSLKAHTLFKSAHTLKVETDQL
jgi:hypothetical protein